MHQVKNGEQPCRTEEGIYETVQQYTKAWCKYCNSKEPSVRMKTLRGQDDTASAAAPTHKTLEEPVKDNASLASPQHLSNKRDLRRGNR